jgi:branched-chain amino acid aminotransferase
VDGFASIDGEISPLASARIPIADRGLLFGDHVFEIALAIGPRVIDGAAHLARLASSASLCGLPPPPAELPRWIAALIAHAEVARAVVRVMWTAGDGVGVRRSRPTRGRAIVTVVADTAVDGGGLRLIQRRVDRAGRGGMLVPAGAKHGNYLGSVLALEAAVTAGGDDALLVDDDAHVLETATANVAIVVGTSVRFATGAILPGVTAARVATLARAGGREATFTPVTVTELAAADEVLVTSSRRGVVPVVAIDGKVRNHGPITLDLAARYREWIASGRDDVEAAPLAL